MILYFSATGNSRYVAERIADKIHTKAISLTECTPEIQLLENEVFGFISPTYHLGLPSIVREYLATVSFLKKPKYSFFVATYGTTCGQTGRLAENHLRDKGLQIDAKFSIKMPDTWTPTFDLSNPNKVAKINQSAEVQIDEIIQCILNCDVGDYMKAKVPMFAVKIYYPTYESQRETKHFKLMNTCIGCGLCVKHCPIQAIKLEDRKPVWVKEKCVLCLGCLHRCPKFSIQYNDKTLNHGQYTHPSFTPKSESHDL